MKKIRFGMIGGGPDAFIGHIHRLAAALDGELVLTCGAFSRDIAKSQQTGRSLGLDHHRIYADFRSMLTAEAELPAAERIQFVAIVTPNRSHLPIAEAAMRAGFHVLCEKPATADVAECEMLAQAVRDSERLFAVAHTYTAYPLVREARERVTRGDIGDVRKIVVEYSQGWLAGVNAVPDNKQAAWRLDPEQAGPSGCMADIGVHAASLAEFISGQNVKEVLADLGRVEPGRILDDDATVMLRFHNGARGVLVASQISVGEENNLTIRVYGTHGRIAWQQQSPNTLEVAGADGITQVIRAGQGYLMAGTQRLTRTPPGHPEGYIEAFANLYREFAAAVRAQNGIGEYESRENKIRESESCNASLPLLCDIDSAQRSMAIIDAVLRSQRGGNCWQRVDEKLKAYSIVECESKGEAGV